MRVPIRQPSSKQMTSALGDEHWAMNFHIISCAPVANRTGVDTVRHVLQSRSADTRSALLVEPVPPLPCQISLEVLHISSNSLDMLQSHHILLLSLRMAHCTTHDIANLPAIEALPVKLLAFRILFDLLVFCGADGHVVFVLVHEAEKDVLALLLIELFVLERNVHARLHGDVKLCNLVGREEEDTAVVLEDSQEHCWGLAYTVQVCKVEL